MENTQLINIIIVDDHEIFRTGLKTQLGQLKSLNVVGGASSGEEFLKLIELIDADIVLMDIKMPGINGIKATEEALKIKPDLKIIALSMFGEEEYLQNILDVGAKGFVLKNIAIKDLERAIILVNNGQSFFSDELLSILMTTFTKDKSLEPETKKRIILSEKELQVLELICKGLSNQKIAKVLNLSPRTIDGHKANIRKKTGANNTVSIVIYAIKNNLVEI